MASTCKKCGNNLYGNKVKCPFCGEPIRGTSNSYSENQTSSNSGSNFNYNTGSNNTNTQRNSTSVNYSNDTGGFGWGLLGFCMPIVGLILYFVWRDEKPLTAKACLNGALIIIGFSIFINIVSACASVM